jgi:DNA repair protein RecO (recombination protein O)
MEYKITGIVLSRTVIKDTDILVSIYSREKGKLNALYKKAKKRAEVMASLEIFCENDFVLSERKIWDVVYDIDNKTTFYSIRGNYEAFLAAAYFAKTVDRLTPENNPTPELYELLRSVLLMLDNGQNPDNVREYFHVNTLKIEGLLSEHKITVTPDEFERVISEYTNTNGGG